MFRQLYLLMSMIGFLSGGWALQPAAPAIQPAAAQIAILDLEGNPLTSFTDGDVIRLRATLDRPAPNGQSMRFFLDQPAFFVGQCSVPANQAECETALFFTLGWYWGFDKTPGAQRTLLAGPGPEDIQARQGVTIRPRPVVLVHGFASNAATWQAYSGPQGFLAGLGVQGFAVGDGQAAGVMNTGSLDAPLTRTNTLLENAAILQGYIAEVKRQTGASMVDLVVHSMGGMISRVYLDRYMGTDSRANSQQGFRYLPGQERDVAQLIMLGTPSLGSDCVVLPAALGWYLPASLEIHSDYARQVLNPQFTHRRGVAFFAIAGVPLTDPVSSPCTGVPSDSVVSRDSASGISLALSEIDLLHSDMTASARIFEEFVRPLLQKSPAEFSPQPDPPAPAAASTGEAPALVQFSQVFTGRVTAGQPGEVIIPIDAGVAVAGFALFDPTRSLTTTVTGASGNVIQLDPLANGLLEIDDPASMLHLGYGFNNPRPGQWRVQLSPTERTPAAGAEYAITARFSGGASLRAYTDAVVAKVGQPIRVFARLEANSAALPAALPLETIEARLRGPSGDPVSLAMQRSGDDYSASWTPQAPGLYALDVLAKATASDGAPIERSALLVVQVESPQAASGQLGRLALVGFGLGGLVFCGLGMVFMGIVWVWVRRRRVVSSKRFSPPGA